MRRMPHHTHAKAPSVRADCVNAVDEGYGEEAGDGPLVEVILQWTPDFWLGLLLESRLRVLTRNDFDPRQQRRVWS